MSDVDAQEREHKFAVAMDADVIYPAELPGGAVLLDTTTAEIDAEYWDTPGLSLWRTHLGVRRRLALAWTFKGPSHVENGAVVREEREWPDAATFPAELSALIEGRSESAGAPVRASELEVVARLHTTRRSRSVTIGDRRVAEIDDDIVTVLDASGAPRDRFREVEVEVHGAPPDVVDALIAAVVAAGGESHVTRKFTRALRATGRIDQRGGGTE